MKILALTQTVDKNNSDLGFFHRWLELLAKKVDLLVVCLKEGRHFLPSNVEVVSLGKETDASSWQYLKKFYSIIWSRRHEYDNVFVHMNPEYVILGGLLWRILGKKVLFWYTHKAVNWRLRVAEKFATKIFTASKESFRLPSRKVDVTGHGIDVECFCEISQMGQMGRIGLIRLLTVGRISPVKDLETVIKAVAELGRRGLTVELDFVGDTQTAQDEEYKNTLVEFIRVAGLLATVRMNGSVPHDKMRGIYGAHDILVHTSRTGSIDKVVLEALAAGLVVFSSSEAFAGLDAVTSFAPNDYKGLASIIEKNFKSGRIDPEAGKRYVRERHDLRRLIGRIEAYFW